MTEMLRYSKNKVCVDTSSDFAAQVTFDRLVPCEILFYKLEVF